MSTANDRPRRILAMGGGGFAMEEPGTAFHGALDRFFFGLARRAKPRVLFVPTASGDAEGYIERFYAAMRDFSVEPSHLGLFRGPNAHLRSIVMESDVVYVGGGNTRNLLALWREWGLDAALREAYESGVVMGGVSAGAIAWFTDGVTDSVAGELRRLPALAWLPGSACPHFDGESERRPAFQRLVAEGMPAGLGIDDGAAVLFENERLARCVASWPDAQVWRLSEGAAPEPLPTERLTNR